MKSTIIGSIIILLVVSMGCSAESNSMKDITVQEAYQSINDSSIVWIDIRESDEFEALPKLDIAKHVPLSDFKASFSALGIQKNQTFYIICRSGNRSKRLQSSLVSEGYTNAVNVLGGMKEWSKMKQ